MYKKYKKYEKMLKKTIEKYGYTKILEFVNFTPGMVTNMDD